MSRRLPFFAVIATLATTVTCLAQDPKLGGPPFERTGSYHVALPHLPVAIEVPCTQPTGLSGLCWRDALPGERVECGWPSCWTKPLTRPAAAWRCYLPVCGELCVADRPNFVLYYPGGYSVKVPTSDDWAYRILMRTAVGELPDDLPLNLAPLPPLPALLRFRSEPLVPPQVHFNIYYGNRDHLLEDGVAYDF